ncbi:MAG: hypothetical protein ACRETW_03700 [Stenotrophobium sp.]
MTLYAFDGAGFYVGTANTAGPYTTPVPPPATGLQANNQWLWIAGQWTQAPLSAATSANPYGTRLTKKAFLLRFTPAEMGAIMASAQSNSGVAAGVTLLNNVDYVDLADPVTTQWLSSLNAASDITAARESAILTAPVTQSEQYVG